MSLDYRPTVIGPRYYCIDVNCDETGLMSNSVFRMTTSKGGTPGDPGDRIAYIETTSPTNSSFLVSTSLFGFYTSWDTHSFSTLGVWCNIEIVHKVEELRFRSYSF